MEKWECCHIQQASELVMCVSGTIVSLRSVHVQHLPCATPVTVLFYKLA